ncbi:MAG: CopL family metal-binding regulatory protein [Lysobacteraceae bacterium]
MSVPAISARLLMHVLLCLALVANGVGAAWAGTRGACCDHAAHAVVPKTTPCHDDDEAMAVSHGTSMHAASMHGMPAHAPQPPQGAPHACDGHHCVCMTSIAGTLPPAPPGLAAVPAHDALADARVLPHAPPALPHPLRPPIRA